MVRTYPFFLICGLNWCGLLLGHSLPGIAHGLGIPVIPLLGWLLAAGASFWGLLAVGLPSGFGPWHRHP